MLKPKQHSTNRLTLRRTTNNDIDNLFRNYTSDLECSRFLTRRPHTNINQTAQFLDKWCDKAWDQKSNHFAWVVALADTDEAIGVFIVEVENHKAQIHYGIGRDFWRKGYAFEFCEPLVEWLKSHQELQRIWAVSDLQNVGSIKILENLRFKNEGILRNWLVLPEFGIAARDCYVFSQIC